MALTRETAEKLVPLLIEAPEVQETFLALKENPGMDDAKAQEYLLEGIRTGLKHYLSDEQLPRYLENDGAEIRKYTDLYAKAVSSAMYGRYVAEHGPSSVFDDESPDEFPDVKGTPELPPAPSRKPR